MESKDSAGGLGSKLVRSEDVVGPSMVLCVVLLQHSVVAPILYRWVWFGFGALRCTKWIVSIVLVWGGKRTEEYDD